MQLTPDRRGFDWEEAIELVKKGANPSTRYKLVSLLDIFLTQLTTYKKPSLTPPDLEFLFEHGLDPNATTPPQEPIITSLINYDLYEYISSCLSYGADYRITSHPEKKEMSILDALVQHLEKSHDDKKKDSIEKCILNAITFEVPFIREKDLGFQTLVRLFLKYPTTELNPKQIEQLKAYKDELLEAIEKMNPQNADIFQALEMIANHPKKKTALSSIFWAGHVDPAKNRLGKAIKLYEKYKSLHRKKEEAPEAEPSSLAQSFFTLYNQLITTIKSAVSRPEESINYEEVNDKEYKM